MMKRFLNLLVFLLAIMAFSGGSVLAAEDGGTLVRISPAETVFNPGETKTVAVRVEDVVGLRAFDVKIQFDPARFTADNLQYAGFLGDKSLYNIPIIDNDAGVIHYLFAILGDDVQSGSGVLFTFDLASKGLAGESALAFTLSELVDEDHFLIPHETIPGSARVLGAVDDFYHTLVNQELVVPAPGVLQNDLLPESAIWTAVLDENLPPDEGELNWSAVGDGGFVYHPPEDWSGITSFTYFACDGEGLCFGPAMAKIFVLERDDLPLAVDDFYKTTMNATLNVLTPGVLKNDFSPHGVTLSAIIEDPLPSGKGDLFWPESDDGSFVYIPPQDWIGMTVFTYRACDGEVCSEPASVWIEVMLDGIEPQAVDDAYQVMMNTQLVVGFPGVLENDILPKSITFTAELVEAPPEGEGHLMWPEEENGGFVYDPPPDWSGTTSFTYRACDGEACTAPARVTITVLQDTEKQEYRVFLPLVLSP